MMAVTTSALTAVIEQVEALTIEERRELMRYLQEDLEDTEDVRVARDRLERLASGETRPLSHEEFWVAIDDFDVEIARTRQNARLMAFLEERARRPGAIPLADVKRELGLSESDA